MSATGSWLTQKAVVTVLRADAGVTSLLATQPDGESSIVDEVREGMLFPYIVVGEGTEKEQRYFGQGGHVVNIELYIYTQDGSLTPVTSGAAGYKQGLAIADEIAETLQDDSLFVVDDHDVVMVNQGEEWGKERLEDGITRVVIPRFEITLEDTELIDGGPADPEQENVIDGGGA